MPASSSPRLEWFRALVLTRMLISCDAAIAWAGPEAASARVQVVLRPFLAAAVFEALRRADCADPDAGDLEREARATWEGSPVAEPARRSRLPRRSRSPAVTRPLTDADDRHHEVADPHPMWTETTWWGFFVPDRALGGMIYTLFRPNLGVATLLVAVWDAEATEPWRVPYHRSQWHLPMPSDGPRRHRGGRAADPLSRAAPGLRPHLRGRGRVRGSTCASTPRWSPTSRWRSARPVTSTSSAGSPAR